VLVEEISLMNTSDNSRPVIGANPRGIDRKPVVGPSMPLPGRGLSDEVIAANPVTQTEKHHEVRARKP
jgi:hypothetical protein